MGKVNLNAMKSKLDNMSQAGNYSNTEYDKLTPGKNVRRILFPKGNSESFYSEGFIHFSLGAEGNRVVTCPKTFSTKNSCPICKYVEELQKSKDKDDKKLAEDMKAKRRIYVNVINRDSDDEEDTPKVLPIGVTILKGLLETICDADYGDITDPKTGRDVTIKRTGTGLKTEYTVLPKPNSSVVSDTLSVEELEENMADLEALFVEKSYEELEAILNGEDYSRDNDEDDEDEDDEDDGYDSLSLEELKELCSQRGIKIPDKATRLKLVQALLEADENEDEEDEEEEVPFDEDTDDEDDDDDEIKNAIAQALARRKQQKK